MSRQKSEDKILPSKLRILKLLWDNHHCKGAADKLCISVHTLYKELKNARTRNKLKSNFALIRLAVEEGKLPLNMKICIVHFLLAANDIFSLMFCDLFL